MFNTISYNLEIREDMFHSFVLIALDTFFRFQLNKALGEPMNLFGFIADEKISSYYQEPRYVSSDF